MTPLTQSEEDFLKRIEACNIVSVDTQTRAMATDDKYIIQPQISFDYYNGPQVGCIIKVFKDKSLVEAINASPELVVRYRACASQNSRRLAVEKDAIKAKNKELWLTKGSY